MLGDAKRLPPPGNHFSRQVSASYAVMADVAKVNGVGPPSIWSAADVMWRCLACLDARATACC
jgi:hypothetical protein